MTERRAEYTLPEAGPVMTDARVARGKGMSALPLTERDRRDGVLGARHSTAKVRHYCDAGTEPAYYGDSARLCLILPGETYWRYYGLMAEAFTPFTLRYCERCHAREHRERGAPR